MALVYSRATESPSLPAGILGLVLLLGCRQDSAPTPPATQPPDQAATEAGDDKIQRFEAWRQQPKRAEGLICHGFLSGSWFHPDGLTHYFVSELMSYDIGATDGQRLETCAATREVAAQFRTRILGLIDKWPRAPAVNEEFAELHLSLDANTAETALQAFLDHRRRDTVRIHRLWVQ